jgi:LCP family protein required for cell wall assembly
VIVAAALLSVVLVITLGAVIVVQSPAEAEAMPTADVREYLPTAVVARSEFSDEESNTPLDEVLVLPDGSSVELVPWDGESRFTMIMVGLDRRPGQTGLSYRTDSMMLVSIDPVTQQIGILSIPRDLYVQVPGYSSLQRINAAMVLGEQQRAGYGPTLLMQTVQLNLGIRVNEYLAVDFQAFIEVVDAIGGITVETDYTINDPRYPSMNYGYDPFYLPAGEHQLNGYDALRFARTRHGDSDIRRAERQQQVLYAIRDKVTGLDMLPSLIARSPQLWAALDDNVYTGLSLEQVVQLALFVRDVPRENISTGVINYRYLQSYTTSSGASVLIPNRARLGNLMVEVFGTSYSQ